ncbi:MAG: signal peptidase I [Chloroflexi bacterium RIFCSPLOWO2_02_FULL_71_16]|nr:MAG: signal peptidase I [Chloroflexi bacterium RIFCSPLOWO2_02_FULL_71_16]
MPAEAEEAFSWRAVLEIVQALALAVIISVFLNLFVVQVTEVRQRSMEPTLFQADRVLVSKIDYRIGQPERGDMVVFNPSTDSTIPFVKRIVAVGGDVVEVRDGQLFVNGEPSEIDEARGSTLPQSPQVVYPYTVPEGEFFAMGDNRTASSDSRSFGSQQNDRIIGKVLLRFWPLDRLSFFEW